MGSSAVDCHGARASPSWSADAPSVLVAVVVNRRGQRTGGDGSADPCVPAASISRVVSSWLKRVMSRVLHPVSPRSSAIRPSAEADLDPEPARGGRRRPAVDLADPAALLRLPERRREGLGQAARDHALRVSYALGRSLVGQRTEPHPLASCAPISSAGAVALDDALGGLGAAAATSPGRRPGTVRTPTQHEEADRDGRQQESHGAEAHECPR